MQADIGWYGDQAGDFEVYVALLGGGIVSEVRAGENNGRKLRHDFVVLVLKNEPLVAGAAELSMPKVMTPGIGRQGLAVWVTRRGQLNPLQATGSWLE